MLTKDLHTHTLYSHGKGTPEENVLAAISCGLKTVAVSEHGPGHMFFGVRGRKLGHLRREMDRLKEKYSDKIEVLFGIESNLVGYGLTDIPKDLLDMFDVRLLAFHKGGRPGDGFGFECYPELPGRTYHRASLKLAKLVCSEMEPLSARLRGENRIRYAYYDSDDQKHIVESSALVTKACSTSRAGHLLFSRTPKLFS